MSSRSSDVAFLFDREQLLASADAHRESFASAVPFPHVVIDDLLPSALLNVVVEEFPAPEAAPWQTFDRATEVKLALADTAQMGPATRSLLAECNGHAFVEFLERMTGIDGLVPDPHYAGGGLHQIRRGGFLKVHADFNRHPRLRLDRRLNVLIYLNRDWPESFGGSLELWDEAMSTPQQSILPVFNRMVVFATTDAALHGHPEPLTCPDNRARRSIALYYYSNGRPEIEVAASHSTLFKTRPGEQLRPSAKQRLKQWIPPALSDFRSSRRR